MPSPAGKRALKQEFDEVHDNTSTSLINITVDKLKLILSNHLECLGRKSAWQVPLSIFLTIAIVFATAEFKDSLGLSKNTWEAMFLMSGVLSLVWLIYSVAKYKSSLTVDELVNKIIDKQ